MRIIWKNMSWIVVCFITLIIIAIIFWLKPHNSSIKNELFSDDKLMSQDSEQIIPVGQSNAEVQSFSSKSQQDIQINCQILVDHSNHLIVNEQTKDCFEYFITQYGEKGLDQIRADFLVFIRVSYKEPMLSQLSDLWSRYLQYREQLGHLELPAPNKDDASYYQEILSKTNELRKKSFSDSEIQGLFGHQDIYDKYTIDRMHILEEKNLSAVEKAEKLKALFDQLPKDWKENLQQLNQLEELRKLTAEIKAHGGSAEELREMRTNLVGMEATQRLEVLDQQRSDWKQRVNQYLAARESIIHSSMSDAAKQSAVSQLRTQQFNDQKEQLRLQTFETIHDQGGKLPFAE